jgi:hypothetical protein
VRRTVVVALLTAALALPASAQIAWESPALISPVAPSGLSLFLIEAAGGDLGALATYRREAGPVGYGFRFAVADEGGPDSDVAIAGGIDISGFLARAVEGSEVDLVWWSGAGLGVGNETLVTIPLGLIIGWSGASGDIVLSPYGGGHVNLDIISGAGDNVDLDLVADLGLDLVLPSGWLLRFGATLADGGRDALALGIRLPT